MDILKSNDNWIRAQCNRYENGQCQTRSCLMRGGWAQGKPVDYETATCDAHETLVELEQLRKANAPGQTDAESGQRKRS